MNGMEMMTMLDKGIGIDKVAVGANVGISDGGRWKPRWTIEKYHGNVAPENLYGVEEFDGNSLLTEGIEELWKVACGIGGTAFDNAHAAIGVGNGTAATTAGMTGLQGTSKVYVNVDTTYPQVSGNKMTVQGTFPAGTASWQWNEFSIANGTNESTAKNLNRKVETAGSHGTKGSLDAWVVRCEITIS